MGRPTDHATQSVTIGSTAMRPNNNNSRFTTLCQGLPGWAGTRRNIHPLTYPDHHAIFVSFFHLLLFKLHAWQSFCTTSVHILFGLPLGLEPSTSYSMHFFTSQCLLFATHAHAIATCFAVVPRLYHLSLSLSSLLGTLSFTLTYLNLLPYLSDLCTDAVKLLCPHLRNKQTFNFLSWHIAAGCHANFTIFCYMGTQEQEILCLYTCLLWHQQKLVCLLCVCSYSNLHAELMSQESFRAISCFTVIFFYLN